MKPILLLLLCTGLCLPVAPVQATEPAKLLGDLLGRAAARAKAADPAAPPAGPAPAAAGPAPAVPAAAAAPEPARAAAAPADPRYRIEADGQEVADTETGLTWRRCSEGMAWDGQTCSGQPLVFKAVVRALDHAKREAAAHGPWRVPSHDELKTLARLTPPPGERAGIQGIDAVAFPATPQRSFWSSTLYYKERGDRDRTKVVYFAGHASSDRGFLDNGEEALLRLVRDSRAATKAPPPRPAAAAVEAAPPAVPAGPRFAVSSDGHEVADRHTGLTWRRCAEGQQPRAGGCAGTALALDHAAAVARASSQGQGWRLPDADELKSIADESRFGLAIDSAVFPATPPEHFWTSFRESADTFKAVHFHNGFVYSRYHTQRHAVRLVRGGKPAEAPAFR